MVVVPGLQGMPRGFRQTHKVPIIDAFLHVVSQHWHPVVGSREKSIR